MDIKALSAVVLEVSSGSVVPSDSVLVEAFVWSDVGSDSDSEVVSELVTNAVSSSAPGSDSLSSGIEGPPLLFVGWVVVLDSESELVSANVLVPEESSVSAHSGLDLELDTAGHWLFWVCVGLEVNHPSLVGAVVALVPDGVSVLRVRVSVNIEASLSHVSNVSSGSVEPSDLLKAFSSVVSGNSGVSVVRPVVSSELDGDGEVSVGSRSNGPSSPVEHPPLLVAVWVVVLDSKSVLGRSNVLVPEEGSSASQLSLDLESSSVSDWVSWEVSSSGVDLPSLVGSVVASPEDNMSVLRVRSTMDVKALAWDVSDVSVASTVVGNHLVVVSFAVLSDDGSNTNSESVSTLV